MSNIKYSTKALKYKKELKNILKSIEKDDKLTESEKQEAYDYVLAVIKTTEDIVNGKVDNSEASDIIIDIEEYIKRFK